MFLIKKNYSVVCTKCNVVAKTLKQHSEEQNRDDPEYFWEPWNAEDIHMYICPNCKDRDFISDSEI